MVIQFPHYALYKNGPNQVGSNVPQTKEEILNQSLKIEQRKRDWVRNRYEEVPLDVPRDTVYKLEIHNKHNLHADKQVIKARMSVEFFGSKYRSKQLKFEIDKQINKAENFSIELPKTIDVGEILMVYIESLSSENEFYMEYFTIQNTTNSQEWEIGLFSMFGENNLDCRLASLLWAYPSNFNNNINNNNNNLKNSNNNNNDDNNNDDKKKEEIEIEGENKLRGSGEGIDNFKVLSKEVGFDFDPIHNKSRKEFIFTLKNGNYQWKLARKYSELKTFHSLLCSIAEKEKIDVQILINFFPIKEKGGKESNESDEEILQKFQDYFITVIDIPILANSLEFSSLLQMPPPRVRSSELKLGSVETPKKARSTPDQPKKKKLSKSANSALKKDKKSKNFFTKMKDSVTESKDKVVRKTKKINLI